MFGSDDETDLSVPCIGSNTQDIVEERAFERHQRLDPGICYLLLIRRKLGSIILVPHAGAQSPGQYHHFVHRFASLYCALYWLGRIPGAIAEIECKGD